MRSIASEGYGGPGRNNLLRLMNLPIRVLSRARDFYVRRMEDCGQVSRYAGAHGVPTIFSVESSAAAADDHRSEDFKELVRAASMRMAKSTATVGMRRIDEEAELEDDDYDDDETRKLWFDVGENGGGGRKQSVVFWRTKSHAVPFDS